VVVIEKQCSRCKQNKPKDAFQKSSTTKDGCHAWCKDCVSIYMKDKYSRPNGKICPICGTPLKGGAERYCSFACHGASLQKIKVGDVFGELRVIGKKKGERWGKSALCLCECSCGVQKWVLSHNLKQGTIRACGNRKIHWSMENSCKWRGGKTKHDSGYNMFKCPDHPNARRSDGYIMEHVFVMSQHIGRPLTQKETVHHKNGIRDDNRLENLELWSSNHPPGQRVSDMIKFCREYLSTYASIEKLQEVI
jgi:hypothetical protein